MSCSSAENHVPVHIRNLDSIRFLAAVWVAISHGALPLKQLFSDPAGRLIGAAIQSSFSGAAAVVVFFVISGLCVHRPYVNAETVPVASFLTRRYVRIVVPLAAMVLLANDLGAEALGALEAVTWSLFAELIYYTSYPLFFYAARRSGWSVLIFVTGALSAYLAFAHLDYVNVQQFGAFTWLWGLPTWLAGCRLAEQIGDGQAAVLPGSIVWWRIGAWGLGAAAVYLANNAPIKVGHPVSMLLFSIYAYFWLEREIADSTRWARALEAMGAASYTLYLTHPVVIYEFRSNVPFAASPIGVLLQCIALGCVSYVFYELIEKPSRHLARRVGQGVFSRLPLVAVKRGRGELELL